MGRAYSFAAALLLCAAAVLAAELDGGQRQALRAQALAAFAEGDYEAMAGACGPLATWVLAQADAAANDYPRLASLLREHLDDCLGLGHAYQLAEQWAEAVAAYQGARRLLDATLKAGLAFKPPDEADAPRRGAIEPPDRVRRRGRGKARPLGPREKAELVSTRAALLLLIGRIQRDVLKDLPAAAATFADGVQFCPALSRPADELARDYEAWLAESLEADKPRPGPRADHTLLYPLETLKELAVTQERLGQVRAAIETRAKLNAAYRLYRGSGAGADIAALAGLVEKLPGDQPVPAVPMLFVLSPQAPAVSLKLDDPQVLAQAYSSSPGRDATHWRFAFSPPPGQEFAALEFACDIEQIDVRAGGQFRCSAQVGGPSPGWIGLDTIRSDDGAPPGRRVLTRRVPVPLGAGIVSVEVCQWKDKFTVHSVTARAELRPREIIPPRLQVSIQSEALPPGGVLTCGGQPIPTEAAWHGLEAGRYEFAYTHRGHKQTFRCEADLVPGGRYGLFVNLDSPFRWSLTTLRRLGRFPPSRPGLVRLPDGRWLIAYGGPGHTVMLSASQDLVEWEEPWMLPHASLFPTVEPSLCIDEKGTLWLAYFCKRLQLETMSSAGYLLWLTHSRDGRAWARPRPVSFDVGGGGQPRSWRTLAHGRNQPCGAVQMLRGPDGRHWLLCDGFLGSADSPSDIRQLRPLPLAGAKARNPHLTIDADGGLHLVWDEFPGRVCYAASADGHQWSAPVTVLDAKQPSHDAHPQLLLDGESAALICEGVGGGWLRQGRLRPAPRFGEPIKITNHMNPLNGSRLCPMPDDEVALFAGQDTVWVLRAGRRDLARPALPPRGEF